MRYILETSRMFKDKSGWVERRFYFYHIEDLNKEVAELLSSPDWSFSHIDIEGDGDEEDVVVHLK